MTTSSPRALTVGDLRAILEALPEEMFVRVNAGAVNMMFVNRAAKEPFVLMDHADMNDFEVLQ